MKSILLFSFLFLFCFPATTVFSQVDPGDIINPNLPDVFAPPPPEGPNLTVTRMVIQELSNKTVVVSFQVLNNGTQEANLYRVNAGFYLRNNKNHPVHIGSTFLNGVSTLGVGESHTQEFKATFPAGTYVRLCVDLDTEKILQETREDDNHLCTNSFQRGASVTHTDLRARPSFAGSNDLGIFMRNQSPGKVFFQIMNTGPVASQPCKTLVEYGRFNELSSSIILDTPAVPAYGTVTVSFSFPAFNCHQYQIKLNRIDHEFVVPETSEANNIVKTTRCED